MPVMSLLRAFTPALGSAKTLGQGCRLQISRCLKTSATKSADLSHGPSALQILPSRYQWHKYKDQLHFYIFLGVIPLSALVFYANVFIGPATLAEIPEGYVPKQWEYFRSPVTRWFARYAAQDMQEVYERNMHYINVMDEKRRMRLLAYRVEELMQKRGDYPNYYTTRTFLSKYMRGMKVERDYIMSTTGEF